MSTENNYEAKEVVCPFYRFEKGHTLYCEGVYGRGIIQTFDTKGEKMAHKKAYCHGHETCKRCKLYQAINEKYKGWWFSG
jgi:hypothetical protein